MNDRRKRVGLAWPQSSGFNLTLVWILAGLVVVGLALVVPKLLRPLQIDVDAIVDGTKPAPRVNDRVKAPSSAPVAAPAPEPVLPPPADVPTSLPTASEPPAALEPPDAGAALIGICILILGLAIAAYSVFRDTPRE